MTSCQSVLKTHVDHAWTTGPSAEVPNVNPPKRERERYENKERRIKRGEHGEYDNRIEPRYCLRWWYCCFYTVCECGLNVDAQIVTGGVSEFHCSLQSTAQHTIPRSVDGEAVGVSEVVEGGSAFEYNKNCLRQEFVSFCMAEGCGLCFIWMA